MHTALKRHLRHMINFWPPFLAAGIRVTRLQPDWRAVDVEMKLHFWNTNFVGTHYGGSLYSMADPFYMLMLIKNLGDDYVVWDKSASIRFRQPGKGKMRASFRLSEEEIDLIRRQLQTQEKVEPVFQVEVKNESGEIVAEVQKVLHVRKKTRNE
jgi:acyl-coenzyme A thioesterase PaaI-like protein